MARQKRATAVIGAVLGVLALGATASAVASSADDSQEAPPYVASPGDETVVTNDPCPDIVREIAAGESDALASSGLPDRIPREVSERFVLSNYTCLASPLLGRVDALVVTFADRSQAPVGAWILVNDARPDPDVWRRYVAELLAVDCVSIELRDGVVVAATNSTAGRNFGQAIADRGPAGDEPLIPAIERAIRANPRSS